MVQSGVPTRLRNDGTFCWDAAEIHADGIESWVEIASQPSSSSLSSIGDEIVTTGLRVQHDLNTRRRRRVAGPSHISLQARQTSSSQEEYEESESEEDRVMTSSNEHIPATSLPRVEYDAGSDSDDNDENATALGRRTDDGPSFTPQPNAFSHPPRQGGSYFPSHAHRQSYPPRPTRQHSSYNSPADHDAALRASLTTLLSIGAAAARGLPKREQPTMTSNEPMGLRFVPESELMAPNPANTSRPLTASTRARSSPSISSQEAAEKGKRKANNARPTTEKVRASKKKKVQVESVEDSLLSPTSLFWAMSAGVAVLVFGAGFVIGREVGRQEAMAGLNGSTLVDTGSCGREVARSSTGTLRRFKWGIGTGSGIVA
ncbi:uncharacterized protein LY89DRAFT_595071 [Mollisia scopiformis]|uniref:Uncharacterized protein n=1 Tax=Mollisia scopiformis TaxID=149040 RepID=A0A194WTW0_MOLSC|nr:uncharacterized protein LY89DRAFT_595071 [Mollisia scopiformis]KUJ11395.1 hypothetical protein LY89DRAFT_595071 [Mollisia scopiformis]